ncbi:fde7507e-8106-4f3a-9dd2-e1f72eccc1ac-CDS [Sclerotinia trifoliorum]|uniref:Peroxisome assembly protein 12 n=1 Tax=Sclerotinia trifoliorum TaxID=28548 RepID=A0A8H2ZRW4_9HELO|nr:fde7507e-8106-4f3a-9dd2-e1f72eccc1ac-CDS [Sclerotinia trifoliorum]
MSSEPPLDPYKPSLFELLSSTQLSSLLPPSLHYLLTIATHRHPRYLLPILNSFHEIHALLFLAVEHHYLTTYSSSFVENFYSLKRERALPPAVGDLRLTAGAANASLRETTKLTRGDVWKNLAVLVGIPYLKRRLDESQEINAPRALLGANYTRMPPNPTLKQRFLHYYRWFLTNVYPSVNAAYYFSILAFNLRYLFSGSKSGSGVYSDPFLWLIGTRIRRLSQADFQAFEAIKNAASSSIPGSNLGIRSLLDPRLAMGRIGSGLKLLLPTSIFALKFLEWWHASDFARQLSRKATEGLELPPPIISYTPSPAKEPETASKSTSEERQPSEAEEPTNPPISTLTQLPIYVVPAPSASTSLENCPICLEEITTPTACQTGYVYCYTCIHRWIEGLHDLQEKFMKGDGKADGEGKGEKGREGKWESGAGRCAVSGRRVLGGAGGLRRVLV